MCCNNYGWLRWVTTTNTAYYCEFNGQQLSDLKDCCQAWKSTIQTNADRIRVMNNEELCDEYFRILNHVLPRYTDSRAGLLEWLKQPAE